MIRSVGQARPRFHTYRRNPGLGSMSYFDLLAQVPRRDCDPYDTACVAQNQADVTAVQDYWDTHMYLPGGVPDGTELSFAPLSSAQIRQFTENITPTGVMRVDTIPYVSQTGPSPIVTTQTPAASPATATAPAVIATPQTPAPVTQTTITPAGQVVTVSNGQATAPGATTPAPASTGLTDWLQGSMFGGIPNWGLLAAGIGALFIFGGRGGR